jgi:N-acylneuraminate cytidylyltransferase
MNTERCLQQKKIVTDNTGSLIISAMEGQDIDNEIDWELAELKYKLIQK